MVLRSGAITGGVFVVSLTILMFLLNGDLEVVTLIFGGLAKYQGYITQSMAYLAILGFGAVAIKTEGYSWRNIGVSRQDLTMAIPVFLALAVGTAAIALYSGDWSQAVSQSGSDGFLLILLVGIVFASFVEEFIFRGYVQNGTTRRFGVTAGIVVSASVFSLIHVPTDLGGLDPRSGLLSLVPFLAYSAFGRFFFGVIAFSTIYYLTGNFFITFFTHTFYDISVFFLVPTGGSLAYRSLYMIIPYVIVFAMYGRRGFPTAIKKNEIVRMPEKLERLMMASKATLK